MSNTIFTDLMTLTDQGEEFFYVDQERLGVTYRIFNYRLASYSNFLESNALECRGIMFQLTDGVGVELDEPLLVCRPMKKFFNLYENPFTMGLDLSPANIERMEMKADGSLISSYIDGAGNIALKSKGSLASEQAVAAMDLLERRPNLKRDVQALTELGYTVNMELCAPYNRIVLNYQEEQLIVLNVRKNDTGEFLHFADTPAELLAIREAWVEGASEVFNLSYSTLIENVKDLVDIEGFIVYLNDGTVFKLKTEWYLTLHRNKDSVDTPRRLFEAAIYEATDDLRTLFHDNQYVLDKIAEMEEFAGGIYNHLVDSVERFVERNRELIENDDRKTYALTAKDQLEMHMMGLAMGRYDQERGNKNKVVDYKEFVVKNWKRWGLKDDDRIANGEE